MKKIFSFLLILNIFLFGLFGQATVDPNNYIYDQIRIWEVRGLVDGKIIPPFRPYKLSNLNEILELVIQNGNEKDVEIAKAYYEELNGKAWNISLENLFDSKVSSGEKEFMYSMNPKFYGDLAFADNFISFGYKIAFINRTGDNNDFLPLYESYQYNTTFDEGVLGPFKSYLDSDQVLSVGNKRIFGQTGIYRSAYGNYLKDNLAISENSHHAGNFSLTFMNDKICYSQQLSIIGATTAYDGSGLKANKYSNFHQITFHISPIFDFIYYETIIYGKRFDPIYLSPVLYMAAQGIGGYDDNLQMGMAFKVKPVNNLQFAFDVFADDLDFNKLVKFNFQGRHRFAVKTGASYTPANLFFTKVDLDYTLITPYTYSHYQGNDTDDSIDTGIYNYQDGTNFAKHIGTIYDPNSDVISLNFDFNPLPRFYIQFNNSFVRHGNVCENYTSDEILELLQASYGQYATDGSIFTHQIIGGQQRVIQTAQDYLNLLNQNHIMYLVKSQIKMTYDLPKLWKSFTISFNADYKFVYVHNYGISNHLYPGGEIVYNSDSNTYTWNGHSYSQEELEANQDEIANYYKEKWINNLTNLLENYFTIGITLKF
ncbi:MAG: hypothetical protein K5866_12025 [Treponema sp.]|nr:hypothetical protein [Treponema sp.]